jgi:thiopurine S-methyltransferase
MQEGLMPEPEAIRDPNENWLQRWKEQNIGWHHVEFNPHLLNYWHALLMPQGSLVLAPLCGKSRDMVWLAQQGYRIRGIELSPMAVEAFFEELGLKPEITQEGDFRRFQAGPYDLLCGDIFDLAYLDSDDIDAVYDRASLVALNPQQREHYASMLGQLLPQRTKMLLVAMAYPQDEMSGPPYSVQEAEVRALYQNRFQVKLLHSLDILKQTERYEEKGLSQMQEQVYILKP